MPVQTFPRSHAEPLARHTLLPGSRTSQQPLLHWSPAQHGWLGPPQPAHALVARQRSPRWQVLPGARQRLAVSQQPPLHTLPGQHGVPGVPHATQVMPEQMVLACVQVFPAQHCWPPWPQATHVCVATLHAAPGAVHWLLAQQGWLTPPQVPQAPLVHTWLLGHMLPAATHTWL